MTKDEYRKKNEKIKDFKVHWKILYIENLKFLEKKIIQRLFAFLIYNDLENNWKSNYNIKKLNDWLYYYIRKWRIERNSNTG